MNGKLIRKWQQWWWYYYNNLGWILDKGNLASVSFVDCKEKYHNNFKINLVKIIPFKKMCEVVIGITIAFKKMCEMVVGVASLCMVMQFDLNF